MGFGYSFTCKNCGERYDVDVGIGMLYPSVYEEEYAKVASGACGADRQELLRSNPYAAIDAEQVVYICDKCNCWVQEADYTVYVPKDVDQLKEISTWGEFEKESEYGVLCNGYSKAFYRVLKRYYRKCDKCGQRMRKASNAELSNLPCPKCGTRNEAEGAILWD